MLLVINPVLWFDCAARLRFWTNARIILFIDVDCGGRSAD